jgi:alpha-L-rhamnosidase
LTPGWCRSPSGSSPTAASASCDLKRSWKSSGVVEAELTGTPGALVGLSFSEREDQPVTYSQRSELVLDAQGRGRFAHHFNHVTARWVRIEGLGRAPAAADLRAWSVRSDYAPASSFRCSDPLLQRIHDTVAWTFECLTLLFDLRAFYADWLDDWAAIQDEFGNLPFTCPTYRGGGGPAWSGIVVMLPWELYLRTGDRSQLERLWPTIERWLAFLETQTSDGLLQFYFDERYTADVYSFLGDWVPPGGVQSGGAPDERRKFFNNAYRVWAVRTAARIAAELEREEQAADLETRAAELARAVHERFFDPERGVYVEARQTYYALPVLAGLGSPELRQTLFDKLVADVTQREHVDTGIHGTWFLVKLMLQRERADLLQLIASQSDFPSWGHMLEQGATTIWEQWDGVHSRAHSSFLSIGAFFTEGLLGIRPLAEAPGYRRFAIAPLIGAQGLESASGHLDTVRGRISVAWDTNGSTANLRLEVPPGSEAVLRLEARDPELVRESGRAADQAPGVSLQAAEAGHFQCLLAPGRYAFALDV